MRWFARVLHKIAISAKLARTPTVATYPRPRRRHIVSGGTLDTVDTIDDMRHVIAALGGWERHESVYSYAPTDATGTAAATDMSQSQATASGSECRDSNISISTSTATPSIRVAARGTRTRPGILNWNGSGKGKGKAREASMYSFSEIEDVQEVLEEPSALPPRGAERRHNERRHAIYEVHDDSTTDSSRDTEIAALILSRSFGYSLRRAPTNQTI